MLSAHMPKIPEGLRLVLRVVLSIGFKCSYFYKKLK